MIDFLIIGGGMAGISTAARVSSLGKTVVLEMEDGLGYHASGRSAAMYEANYGEASTVAMNIAARAFFEEHDLLTQRGFMVLAKQGDKSGFDAACAELKCPAISVSDAVARVPILDTKHLGFAAFNPDAFDIDTDRMLQLFAKQARGNGADIQTGAKVTSITRSKAGWTVTSNSQEFECKLLINAAGAWVDQIAALAGIAGIGIMPKRRSMVRIPEPGGHDVSTWPMLMDAHENWYAKPDAGKLLISPADEDPQPPHDAWADDMVLAEGIARYQNFVTEEVTRVESSWAGLRSFAPDKNLVIGPAPQDSAFFWMAGQGGYGIQSAPSYSQIAADLISGASSPLIDEIGPAISPDRFSG